MSDWHTNLNPFRQRSYQPLERRGGRATNFLERSSSEIARAHLRISAATLQGPSKLASEASRHASEVALAPSGRRVQLTTRVTALARRILDFSAGSQKTSKELLELRNPLLGNHILSSDWQQASAAEVFVNPVSNSTTGSETPSAEASGKFAIYKEHFYRAAETGGNVGGVLSAITSGVTSLIKAVTSVVSPLGTAVPFIGLFNGLMNGFQFGKGIDRLHFYNQLARELKPENYDQLKRNFGPHSARILASFPHLGEIDIAPNRLLRLLRAEVTAKRVKYSFYLTSKALGFGASVVGFLGGLAAFSAPVFAFPALFVGLPPAVCSIAVGTLGNYICKRLRDPLISPPKKEPLAEA